MGEIGIKVDDFRSFLKDILVFLENNDDKTNKIELEKRCQELLQFVNKTVDEVDDTRYMNMSGPPNQNLEDHDQFEYIEVQNFNDSKEEETAEKLEPVAKDPNQNIDSLECPYLGLPAAHLKLNSQVIKTDDHIKLANKRSSITLALLSGRWLILYNAKNIIRPSKCLYVYEAESKIGDKSDKIFKVTTNIGHFEFFAKSDTVKAEWIDAISKEICNDKSAHTETLYDEPNNLKDDQNLERILRFNYDIPKMPPKPVQTSSSNRLEFQLKYQVIKEQLSSQLKPKGSSDHQVSNPSSSNSSPSKKFSKLINLFRISTNPNENISDDPSKAKMKRKSRIDNVDASLYEVIERKPL